MSERLILELPPGVYEPVASAARQAGQTPEQWAMAHLVGWARSEQERAAGLARLLRHAGAVNLGHPTGADNAAIDADLASAYGATHEASR
jgi:hypothetical protein